RSQHAGGDVIGMAFDAGSFVENASGLPAEIEKARSDNHPRGNGGGARSKSFAEGNFVGDKEIGRSKRAAFALRDVERGLPDEVIFADRNKRGIASFAANREPRGGRKTAGEIYLESDAQGIEAGAQISAGGRDA